MASAKGRGTLLDVSYKTKSNSSEIQIFVSTENGIIELRDGKFKPYFYIIIDGFEEAEKALNKTKTPDKAEIIKTERAEFGEEKALRLFFNSTKDLSEARDLLKEESYVVERREYDIPFAKRYIIDKDIEPMGDVEFECDGKELVSIKRIEGGKENLSIGAFDLETLAPGRFSDATKDPIITAAYSGKKDFVFSTKKGLKEKIKVVKSEKELIEKLVETINQEKPEIIASYNGDSFDFPYLKERAERAGVELFLSSDKSKPAFKKSGRGEAARLKGVQHLDVFKMLLTLRKLGAADLVRMDLESVCAALLGEEKEKLSAEDSYEIWKSGEGKGIDRLAKYNLEDSDSTRRIGELYLPLMSELSRTVRMTLYDTSRASASILIEQLLLKKSSAEGLLFPNKPREFEVKQRMMQRIKGGFVKEPKRGLHENIAVLDFSSLYPTIIISHNISPETFKCEHESCKKNISPEGHCFCTQQEGFFTSILKELYTKRMKIKKKLKTMDKKNKEYKMLNARQMSFKILMNSFYGYLGYARSRWYSRDCGAAITAWSRQYVQQVGKRAEEAGFEWIYGDTDSAFLKIPKEKTEKDVKSFVKEINSELPGVMNLELEGFFSRGIFVTKKVDETAAKKRYALMGKNNRMKIVGFEYVRRDWAKIARETQRQVLEAVLRDGDTKKAVKIAREVISRLQEGKADNSELTIMTQIKKSLAKYESIGPHVSAAKKAVAKGKDLGVGSIISYIITKKGKTISERAELAEYVEQGDYDPKYYIENQVIPAVKHIMRELGYDAEDLIHGGKQKTLGSFS